MAQRAVVLLALFAQMDHAPVEHAAHARGRDGEGSAGLGRRVAVDRAKLEWTAHLRESGHTPG